MPRSAAANPKPASRRQFLATSAALAAGAAAVPLVHAAQGQGRPTLKVGLIGCGGRGTGAAAQALHADPDVKLWAMGDAFRDRLDTSLATLRKDEAIARK